jgi:hypothetical protein
LVTGSISGYIVLDFDKDEGRALFNEHKVAGTCAVNITANGFTPCSRSSRSDREQHGRRAGLDVREKRLHHHPAVRTSTGKRYQWQIAPWVLRPAPPLPAWFWPLWNAKMVNEARLSTATTPNNVKSNEPLAAFAQGHGCVMPADGWTADGKIHRCDAYGPDGKLGRGDGSYLVFPDHPVMGFIQNHHRHQQMQQWRPSR